MHTKLCKISTGFSRKKKAENQFMLFIHFHSVQTQNIYKYIYVYNTYTDDINDTCE